MKILNVKQLTRPKNIVMGDLFKKYRFSIPVYQRNYSWGRDEIIDFCNDLQDLVNGKQSIHFFGQIVTFEHSRANGLKYREVVDGQQRLITSQLLLAVIRNVADEIKHHYFAKENSKQVVPPLGIINDIGEHKYSRSEISFQIVNSLGHYIDGYLFKNGDVTKPSLVIEKSSSEKAWGQYFNGLISSSIDDYRQKPAQISKLKPIKNIHNAYQCIYKCIQASVNHKSDVYGKVSRLFHIYSAFVLNFYLILITAPAKESAFVIFETLNSRGKSLSSSDIIKNHVMSEMSNQKEISQANDDWEAIASFVNNDSKQLTRVIRTYWLASHKLVSSAQLYRMIGEEIDNRTKARSFLSDLKDLINLYNVLVSPLHPKKNVEYLKNISRDVFQNVDILKRIHAITYYPIMFAIHHRNESSRETCFDFYDIQSIINEILRIFIRLRTISKYGTNVLESSFARIAQRIWNGKLNDVKSVIKALDDALLIPAPKVQSSFKNLNRKGSLRGEKKWTLEYLLSCIYSNRTNSRSVYENVFHNDDYMPVHIGKTDPNYEDYLGNWTLIEHSLYNKLTYKDGHSNIADVLRRSDLLQNKELAKKLTDGDGQWSDRNIVERQNSLGRNVTKLW